MGMQPWLENVEDALLDLFDFCDEPRHQNLVANLLSRTSQLTEEDFSEAIKQLAAQIQTVWALAPKKTWFVSSNNKENTDSSQEVLNRLKAHHWDDIDWNKKQFLTRYGDVAAKLSDGDNVVIVDDFIGTGRSMTKTIDWFRNFSAQKNLAITVRVCVVAGCATGLAAIVAQGIDIKFAHTIQKGISDHFAGSKLEQALIDMDTLETKLSRDVRTSKFDDFKLGYGKSEAMYFRAGGNTPNNVFPVFWWRATKKRDRRTVMNRT
jgi:hypoxanthine phosphoribosyltransferase